MTEHEHPLLSYRELLNELQQLLSQRTKGVMFISTLDNHAVQIGIDKGQIIGCRFRFKRGKEALPLIMDMEAGHYSFTSGPSGSPDNSLPPTDTLLQILASTNNKTPADMPIQGNTELAAVPALIATELALYLGPIATILVEDYLDENGPVRDNGALKGMITALASEIADQGKRKEFFQHVLSKL